MIGYQEWMFSHKTSFPNPKKCDIHNPDLNHKAPAWAQEHGDSDIWSPEPY